MKKFSKTVLKKCKGNCIIGNLFSLLFFALFSLPIAANGQTCYCDEPNAKTIGSDVGVETVSEAVSLGLLDQNPSPFYPAQSVCIKGDLTVDIGYSFYGSKVNLYPGANIIINGGKTLGILERLTLGGPVGSVLSGCSAMWNSIVVNSFATLVMKGSTIRDGEVAVDARAVSNLSLIDNDFFDNHIGLRASSSGSGGAVSFVNLLGPIHSNVFRTTTYQGLLPPHSGENGYAGIEVTNIAGFTVGALSGPSVNTFLLLDNGIVATNSSIAVHNASLLPSLTTAAPTSPFLSQVSGNGILLFNSSAVVTNCRFDNNTAGVHAVESSVEVTGCNFNETVGYGVVVDGTLKGRVVIKNNPEMLCFSTGIFLQDLLKTSVEILNNHIQLIEESDNPVHDAFSGIYIGDCSFSGVTCTIADNVIELDDGSFGINLFFSKWVNIEGNNNITINSLTTFDFNPSEVVGIKVTAGDNHTIMGNPITGQGAGVSIGDDNDLIVGIRAVQSSFNTFCCNTTDFLEIGQRFDGPNGGTEYWNAELRNHGTALHMDADGAIGPQVDAGNKWNFASLDVGARHESGNDFAENSQFRVQSLGLPNTPVYPSGIDPNPQTTGVDWFLSGGGTPLSCCALLPTADNSPDYLDNNIAADSVDSGTPFSGTTGWLLKRYLFAKLDSDPILVQQYPAMATFYNANLTSTVGAFHAVEKNITDMAGQPANETQQYRDNIDSLFAKLWELVINDSLLATANPADSALLVAQRQVIVNEMAAWENENDSLLTLIRAHQAGLAQQYLAQNAAIQATAIYETNEKTVNDIYLNTVAQGVFALDAPQRTALEAIVWQCPKMGGNAVYRARSLYSLAVDTLFDDAAICFPPPQQLAGNTGQIQQQANGAGKFRMFPNPAANKVTLVFASKISANGVNLVNLNGQLVAQYAVPAGLKDFSFPVGKLPAGMYFVKLMDGKQAVHTEKLMIAR